MNKKDFDEALNKKDFLLSQLAIIKNTLIIVFFQLFCAIE